MMGNSGAGHVHQRRDIDYALLCVTQKPKDTDSCSVTQLINNICNNFKSLHLKQPGFHSCKSILSTMLMGQRRMIHASLSLFAGLEILFACLAGSILDVLTSLLAAIILQVQQLYKCLIVKIAF